MRPTTLFLAVLLASPALAADDPPPRILVSGTGSVATPPDRATLEYTIRGEGQTSDAAVIALAAKRRAIEGGLGALAQPVTMHASKVAVREVRDPQCKADDDAPRLTSGRCTIVGYVAEIASSIATSAVVQAGTMVGLIARAGGIDPRVEGFSLTHPQDAERRALAIALVDARHKAEEVAEGTGAHLGRPISVSTDPDGTDAQDVIVTASRLSAPPAIVAPPIPIDITPSPVETHARVLVTYAIAP